MSPVVDPDEARGDVGAAGTPTTVTAFEGADAKPGPAELAASTVKVYETPLVSPGTTTLVAGNTASTNVAPGIARISYM